MLGAGVVRKALGGYRLAFLASGAICMVAALLALAIRRGRARPAVEMLPARTA